MAEETNRLLEAALALAIRGIPVFPLHTPTAEGGCSCSRGGQCKRNSPGKHPRISDWQAEASTDQDQIRRWWRKWPDANIGMPTGALSGIVCLDVDAGHLGFQELDGKELGEGPSASTGNGVHIFYAHPGGDVVLEQRIGGNGDNWPYQHIDFKGDGNYVVAAPSLHYSGREYSWIITPDTPFPPVPAWLLADHAHKARKSSKKADHAPRPEVIEKLVATAIRRVEDGAARNDTGFWLLTQLRDERVSAEDALEAARPYYTAVAGLGDHAYGWDELTATLASVYTRPARDTAFNGGTGKKDSVTWAANEYIRRYGEDMRYVRAWKAWFHWNGRIWERDTRGLPLRYAHDFVVGMRQDAALEVEDARKLDLLKLASSLDKRRQMEDFITVAGVLDPVAAQPSQFDADTWHAVAANGIIDLRTGSLLPFDRTQYHTKQLGVPGVGVVYDPRQQCPNWLAFLETILQGNKDDIRFVQRAFGYTLTGETSEQCWFLLAGDGNNGKSTFIKVLLALLGTYGSTVPVATLLKSQSDRIPNDIAMLMNVRGAFASESEEGRSLAESLVKLLTGGDEISARFLHGEFFTFTPVLKLWMHTNHIPKIRGQDIGTWRRIRLIPFTYQVPEADVDKYLFEKKLLPELPGILAWAMEGCLAWQREGTLGEPATMKDAVKEFREASDLVRQYVQQCVVQDPAVYVQTSVIYEHFSKWCRTQGDKAESSKTFGKRMFQILGVESQLKRMPKTRTVARIYPGIRVDDANCSYGMLDTSGTASG